MEEEKTPGAEQTGTTETVAQDTAANEVDVLFVDPAPQTTYTAENNAYEIDIIHSITFGDILISTLLSMLIIITLLSRLLGRSY